MVHAHDLKSLYLALFVTVSIFLLELFGGLYSNSLSLVGDSAHMFFDAFSLLLAISAIKISCRIPSKKITFGFHRFEVFAALINGLLLCFVSFFIFVQALSRLSNPSPILGLPMLVVSVVGFFANLFVLKKFHVHDDLNVKGAYLHVLSDTLTSVGVIVGAVFISFTGLFWVDGLIGLLISVFILFGAFRLVKDSLIILLQGTPSNVDVDEIIREMEGFKEVLGVHHVHVWSLCSNINILSAHVVVGFDSLKKCGVVMSKLNKRLKKFGVGYTTLQFELESGKKDKLVHLKH